MGWEVRVHRVHRWGQYHFWDGVPNPSPHTHIQISTLPTQNPTPAQGYTPVESLLPVDHGPQGSPEAQEGLKDQIFPVETEIRGQKRCRT